jgi:leucyl-tRNA synthetase
VERLDDSWSEPINAGPNINSSANEYYISFTKDGSMYFSSNVNAPEEREWYDFDIYSSKYINGVFQKAVPVGKPVNTEEYEADVFVDPNEQYLIFCGTKAGGYGRGDLYISFKKEDGTWSKSVNMGNAINTKHHELCPFVTMDGKYLFYTSDQDIYWVSTKIFDQIRSRIK